MRIFFVPSHKMNLYKSRHNMNTATAIAMYIRTLKTVFKCVYHQKIYLTFLQHNYFFRKSR